MKNLLLPLFFLLIFTQVSAQEINTKVDEVRVYFDKTKINAKQVGMDLSPSGKFLVFAFDDGIIRVFDTSLNRFISSHRYDYTNLFEIRFSKKEEALVIVESNKWQLVNWKSKESIYQQELFKEPTRVAIGKNNNWLAIGTHGVEVQIFDLESKDKIFSITMAKGNHIGGLDFSFDDKYLVTYGRPSLNVKSLIDVYEVSSQQLVVSLKTPSKIGANFSNEENYIIHYYNMLHLSIQRWNFLTNEVEDVQLISKFENLVFPANIYTYKNNYVISGLSQGFGIIDQNGEVKFSTRRSNDEKSKGGRAFAWQMGIDVNNIKRIPNTSKFIINAFGTNINQIFDADKAEIIGYFYTDSNEEHAIIARDGRVDGSMEAFSKLAWTERKSDKRLPMDVNLEQFITPKLYSALTGSDAIVADNSYLRDAIAFAPEVNIITPDSISTASGNTIEVTYKTTAHGDPVKNTLVLVNGKAMGADTRGFKRIDNESVTVTIVSGHNIIQLIAVSEKGYQSVADQIIVNYDGAKAESELYMLTIGLNEYRNPKYNLNYAQADATAFQNEVKDGSTTIFSSVKNYFIENQDATKEKILDTFNEISSTIGPEDVFVFYYAGHGVMSQGDKPVFYIVPYGVTQLYGNEDMLIEKAISADMLKSLSEAMPAQKQLFVLDACQSGGMTEMLAMRGAAEEKAIAQLARSTGTYWLTASNSEQFATEFATLGHGLFTYTILEGLSGKADGGSMDKKITVKELSAYLNDRVPELSEQHKGQPQFPTSYGFGQDFPIVIIK